MDKQSGLETIFLSERAMSGMVIDRETPRETSRETNVSNQERIETSPLTWANGKTCAVSFLYLGGLSEHIDLAVPLLDSLNMTASFYIESDHVLENAKSWQSMYYKKHEIGCAPFEFITLDGSLPNWSNQSVQHELHMSKNFVSEFFGREASGFAYSGAKTFSAEGDFQWEVQSNFSHAVSAEDGVNNLESGIYQIQRTPVVRYPSPDLTQALNQPDLTWIVIPFRKLFGESHSNILVHRMILEAINRRRNDVWIAPVGEVVDSLRQLQQEFLPVD